MCSTSFEFTERLLVLAVHMSTCGSKGTPETKSSAYGAFANPAASFGVSGGQPTPTPIAGTFPLEVEHELKSWRL